MGTAFLQPERPPSFSGLWESQGHLVFGERRRKTLRNRLRRFLNDHWVLPTLILYLEFLAVVFPPLEAPLEKWLDRNVAFFNGVTIFYNLVTYDFPESFLGHLREVVLRASLGEQTIPYALVARAARHPESLRQVDHLLNRSLEVHHTEVGGLVSLVQKGDEVYLRFHPVPSLNGKISRELHHLARQGPEALVHWLQDPQHQAFLQTLRIPESLIQRTLEVLQNEQLAQEARETLVALFVETYDRYSEATYLLSPYAFKAALGALPWRKETYLGLFHLHTTPADPPSEADVAASYQDRQLVLTYTHQGYLLYDVEQGEVRTLTLPPLPGSRFFPQIWAGTSAF